MAPEGPSCVRGSREHRGGLHEAVACACEGQEDCPLRWEMCGEGLRLCLQPLSTFNLLSPTPSL